MCAVIDNSSSELGALALDEILDLGCCIEK